eukprot:TRINITY_DN12831_c0_g1_i1.p1 TRINITY_DN12831_c0_g1~~TRINITY_DN12831_c0_g1_i1.p1  ORF type:complete len:596 (-),score=59.70 TRINITY_DN12831_c0_g1_i1:783-2570(-)
MIQFFHILCIMGYSVTGQLEFQDNINNLLITNKLSFSFQNYSQSNDQDQDPEVISQEIFITLNLTNDLDQQDQISPTSEETSDQFQQTLPDISSQELYANQGQFSNQFSPVSEANLVIADNIVPFTNYLIEIQLSPISNCQEVDDFFIQNFKQLIEFFSKCVNCALIASHKCVQQTSYEFLVNIFSVNQDNYEQLIESISNGLAQNYDYVFEIQLLQINGEQVVLAENVTEAGIDIEQLYQPYFPYEQIYEQDVLENLETCPDSAYDIIAEGCLLRDSQPNQADKDQLFFLPVTEEKIVEEEIIGGVPVDPERYPYMMSLQVKTKPDGCFNSKCGGTLISPDLVLTAAHCLVDEQGNGNVETGAPSEEIFVARAPICRHESGQSPRSQTIFQYIHPNFTVSDDGSFAFDIAILRIGEIFPPPFIDLNTSQHIQLITDDTLSIIGYGAIADPEADPLGEGGVYVKERLQLGRVKYVDNQQCKSIVESVYAISQETITEEKLCVDTFEQGIVDTCIGDSGGPILVDGGDAILDVQVGITSYGFRYADGYTGENFACGGTTVYTRISEVLPWIYETLPEVEQIQRELQSLNNINDVYV